MVGFGQGGATSAVGSELFHCSATAHRRQVEGDSLHHVSQTGTGGKEPQPGPFLASSRFPCCTLTTSLPPQEDSVECARERGVAVHETHETSWIVPLLPQLPAAT